MVIALRIMEAFKCLFFLHLKLWITSGHTENREYSTLFICQTAIVFGSIWGKECHMS